MLPTIPSLLEASSSHVGQLWQAGSDLDRQVGVPAGWRQCPNFSVVPSLKIIAAKVCAIPCSKGADCFGNVKHKRQLYPTADSSKLNLVRGNHKSARQVHSRDVAGRAAGSQHHCEYAAGSHTSMQLRIHGIHSYGSTVKQQHICKCCRLVW